MARILEILTTTALQRPAVFGIPYRGMDGPMLSVEQ